MAESRISIAWPVTRGTGDRSIMVMDTFRRVRVSQYARQGSAMPAPEMRTFSFGEVIVFDVDVCQGRMKAFS